MSAMNAAARDVLLAAGYSPCAGDLGHWQDAAGQRYSAPDALRLVAAALRDYDRAAAREEE